MDQSQAEIKAIAAQLQTTPVKYSLQVAPISELELTLWQQLEDQISYLDQLAAEQEIAILKFKTLMHQVETSPEVLPDLIDDRAEPDSQPDAYPWREALGRIARSAAAIALPIVEGFVWCGVAVGVQVKKRTSNPEHRAKRLHRRALRQPIVSEQESFPNDEIEILPTLQEALTLTAGAVLMRIVLDRIVQLYPTLWIIAIGLMVSPAAVAVYRSTRSPQSGFLWGCRLTLITIGLLLGGRV